MNEEAIKTKADKDKEVKKWTTFLQKPNRPIPRSAKEQVQYEPYRVKIVRQPKPMCDPNRVRTPPPVEAVPEALAVPNGNECIENTENTGNTEPQSNVAVEGETNEDNCDVADSEVPDLEVCVASEVKACEEQQIAEIVEQNASVEGAEVSEDADVESKPETVEETPSAKQSVSGAEETQLEKQLQDVQNQLAALSSLPSTIQTMLESVSRQLDEILPAFKLRTSIDLSGSINGDSKLQITEKIDFEKEVKSEELDVEKVDENGATTTTEITDSETQVKECGEVSVEICTNVDNANADETVSEAKQNDPQLSNDEIARQTEEQILKMKTERVFQMQEEDWNRNKV